jgi:hypothetical protein
MNIGLLNLPIWLRCICAAASAASLWLCPALAMGQVVNIGVNVSGLSQPSTAILEPDVSGAAGPGSYAEFVNGAFGVFSKATGAISSQSTDQAFWEAAGIPASTFSNGVNASNPRLIYDPNSGRWFATEITNNATANNILLAVSTGSDPSPTKDNWNAVSFSTGTPGSAYPYGAFPTLGIDANGVYIATDDQSAEFPAYSGQSASLFSIPKSDLLETTPSLSHMTAFSGSNDIAGNNYDSMGFILQPVIDFSPQKGSAVVIADNVREFGGINKFNVMGTATSNASLGPPQTVTLQPYVFPPSPRQPDRSGGYSGPAGLALPNDDDRYASSAYQVGNLIYTVHTVGLPADAPNPTCALQWSVLKACNDGKTVLVQQGTISNPNYDYFNPSICANADGAVVIGYNRSGTSQTDGMIMSLVSVGATIAGTITFQSPIQLTSTTVTSFHNSTRASPWGDYSSMSPDPSNSSIFWLAEEVPEPSSNGSTSGSTWGTQISEVEVPEPSSLSFVVLAETVALALRRHRHRSGYAAADVAKRLQWAAARSMGLAACVSPATASDAHYA